VVAHGDYAIQSGFKASLRLLEQNPTAVFVANDLMTIGFMKALGNKGLRCPNDIAVVSYDDGIRNEVFLPKLTCVEQPKYMLGYRSAELLFSRILASISARNLRSSRTAFGRGIVRTDAVTSRLRGPGRVSISSTGKLLD